MSTLISGDIPEKLDRDTTCKEAHLARTNKRDHYHTGRLTKNWVNTFTSLQKEKFHIEISFLCESDIKVALSMKELLLNPVQARLFYRLEVQEGPPFDLRDHSNFAQL